MSEDIKNTWDNFWDKVAKEDSKKSSKFRIEPVSAKIFFRDWLDTPLFPRQYRAVEAAFSNDFKNISSTKNDIILGWGKRAGKDLTIANLLTYMLYWLCCLNDPQEYLGIKSGEPIDIVNVAFDKTQAKTVFFEKFVRKVKSAINPVTRKNFFEEIGINLDRAVLKDSIQFPNNIRAWSLNSVEYKAEGKNVVFAIFDEIAQFRFDKAASIHKHIRTTAKMTFLKYYKLFFISYLTSGTDYMAYLLDKAEQKRNTKTYIDRAATWDVRSIKHCPKELKKYTVLRENYQEDYDEDPIASMLMYECRVPKFHANNLIKRPERILECVNMDRPDPRIDSENLWTYNLMKEEFEAWFAPYTTWEIWNLKKEYETNPTEELTNRIRVEKERHQYAEYFNHLDLSRGVVDVASFAFGHKYFVLDTIKLYIDLIIQIRGEVTEAGEHKEIDMEKILQFTLYLKNIMKFPITRVTADGWNSALFLDICRKNDMEAKLLSPNEKNSTPYITLKDFIYRTDLNLYYYSPVIRELTELIIDDKKKIDHPRKSSWRMKEEGMGRGSNDCSDGLAGITASMMEDTDSEPLAFAGR